MRKPGIQVDGFPPSGNRIAFTWIDIYRIENGKLVESWVETNVESLKKQLSSNKD
jgi:predicted ester cyclase